MRIRSIEGEGDEEEHFGDVCSASSSWTFDGSRLGPESCHSLHGERRSLEGGKRTCRDAIPRFFTVGHSGHSNADRADLSTKERMDGKCDFAA